MKTILYMAISLDGFIAKPDGDSSFTSAVDTDCYNSVSKKIGNIIMGRNTFEYLEKESALPLDGRKIIVMTHDKNRVNSADLRFTDRTPKEVLKWLAAEGFKKAFIAGGGELNRSFLDAGLVDELYITVEPIILGSGIKLFSDGCQEKDLELLETVPLSINEVQLRYRVRNR